MQKSVFKWISSILKDDQEACVGLCQLRKGNTPKVVAPRQEKPKELKISDLMRGSL